jgi:hypothetical protein
VPNIAPAQPPENKAVIIEQVVMQGDLAKLGPEERLSYYRQVCESVGLNPLTQPFTYLVLNGRLTLYARKDATDQLRRVHEVSVTIVSREDVRDTYVVTARATLPSGRTDESIGAVSLVNLKGDALANALMKSETKAKRRVTLSICGLGFLDETEIETIPEAQPQPEPAPARPARQEPADGLEFSQRIVRTEIELVEAGRCQKGDLVAHLVEQGKVLGEPADLVRWDAAGIKAAKDWVNAFLALHPQAAADSGNGKKSLPAWVGMGERQALQDLLAKKGVKWQLVAELFGIKVPSELTPQIYSDMIAQLEKEPDAPAGKK